MLLPFPSSSAAIVLGFRLQGIVVQLFLLEHNRN